MQAKGKSVTGKLLNWEESGQTAQRRRKGNRRWEGDLGPRLGEEGGKTLEP